MTGYVKGLRILNTPQLGHFDGIIKKYRLFLEGVIVSPHTKLFEQVYGRDD